MCPTLFSISTAGSLSLCLKIDFRVDVLCYFLVFKWFILGKISLFLNWIFMRHFTFSFMIIFGMIILFDCIVSLKFHTFSCNLPCFRLLCLSKWRF